MSFDIFYLYNNKKTLNLFSPKMWLDKYYVNYQNCLKYHLVDDIIFNLFNITCIYTQGIYETFEILLLPENSAIGYTNNPKQRIIIIW